MGWILSEEVSSNMAKKYVKSAVLVFVLALILVSAAAMAQTPIDAVTDCVVNSGIFPAGTSVVSVSLDGDIINLDLSAEAVAFPFTDTQSDAYTDALFAAVSQWPEISAINVTVGGVKISAFLPANTSPDAAPSGDFSASSLGSGFQAMSAQNPLLPPNVAPVGSELAGKLIVLGPSHGTYAQTTNWIRAQRTLCGPNPQTNRPPGIGNYMPSDYYYWTKGFQWPMYYEDDMSPELIRYLYAYCKAAGAATFVNRNLNKTAGNFPYAQYGYPNPGFTMPRWMTSCKYYLEDMGGIPSWVWNTSDVSAQSDKDLRARAYYVNYLMQTLGYTKDNTVYLALHSNAATATQCTPNQSQARGTEDYNSLAYTSWTAEQAKSPQYATGLEAAVISSIRNEYDGFWAEPYYDAAATPVPPEWCTGYGTYRGYKHAAASTPSTTAGWQDRGPKSGNYGEIRECKCPAVLMELLFHDNWKFYPDEAFHQDPIFRATVTWGMYEGISTFLGVAPRPRLAASVDSVSFPQFVAPGAALSGTISIKNLGQAWCWGKKMIGNVWSNYNIWDLAGAAGDQFGKAGTKIAIANDGNYYPGDTAAFSVALTAPAETGTYTTAWQMLKDDAKGGSFGAVASAQIGVDGIAPEISITAPEDKWYNGDPITVAFSATDNMSGVDTITANVDGTDVASGDAVSALGSGLHTLAVTAKDKVGNTATKSQSFKVDALAPDITIAAPQANAYLQTGAIAINFSASDAHSGVASTTATMDGVAIANATSYSLLWNTLGSHTLAVTSTDNVGNVASTSVTFTIGATIESIIQAVNELYGQGQIDNQGIQNSLLAKLAKYEKDNGNSGNAKNYLKNFINEVSAQSGKHLTVAAANVLLADAQYCIAHLPAE
jgi:N-acetylmuramoyl-L-alanine amidase